MADEDHKTHNGGSGGAGGDDKKKFRFSGIFNIARSNSGSHSGFKSPSRSGSMSEDAAKQHPKRSQSGSAEDGTQRIKVHPANATSQQGAGDGVAQAKSMQREERAKQAKEQERQLRLRRYESDLRAEQVETREQRSHYGSAPLRLKLKDEDWENILPLDDLQENLIGHKIATRARVHAVRAISAKLAFIVLRKQVTTVQAVLHSDGDNITRHMVRWAEHLPLESDIVIRGELQKPSEPLRSTTYENIEIKIEEIFVVNEPSVELPFTPYRASTVGDMVTSKPSSHQQQEHQKSASSASASKSGTSTPKALEEEEEAEPDSAVDGASLAANKEVNMMRTSTLASLESEVDHASSSNVASTAPSEADANDDSALERRTNRLALAMRMSNRVLDLRTPYSQAIFRVQSATCRAFRNFLDDHDFIEIHTPKLLGGASESGASVFPVDYFGRSAFLAQSPQLMKQMCIVADFNRVFEIGPVFRAENSNTHRHLTEYTGLDLEMALGPRQDYHEAMDIIDELLKSMFVYINRRYPKEVEIVLKAFGQKPLVWLDKTPVLDYAEGIQMLVDSGYRDEGDVVPSANEDLSTRAEMRLGALVKEKYGTDYYILDKFPASVRPFYTMPAPGSTRNASNSFDIFVRGQEIISGSQRVHQAEQLIAALKKQDVDIKGVQEYVDSFKLAAPAHAGCGIGLERFVMLFLGLDDIRNASLFPRDPKSLRTEKTTQELRHPEAGTNPPPWKSKDRTGTGEDGKMELQPLPKLIANYGNSTNTSWLDDRFEIWRDEECGAAIGYVASHGYAVIVGDPLCDASQFARVSKTFIDWLASPTSPRKDGGSGSLKPLWLLVSDRMEFVLGQGMNWSSLSCVAESRVPPAIERRHNAAAAVAASDKEHITMAEELERKLRQAKKEGLSSSTFKVGKPVPDDVKKQLDAKVDAWKNHRKGKQVHLTEVNLFRDAEHRSYTIVKDSHGEVTAVVVLAQLSAASGFQIKWALDFPGAPSGAIEFAVMESIADTPQASHTFGASAVAHLKAQRGIKGVKAKALSATYEQLVKSLRLLNKGEFRRKFGAVQEDLFICFPKKGMSTKAIRAIIDFFSDE